MASKTKRPQSFRPIGRSRARPTTISSCHSLCFHAAATLKVGTKSGTDDANNVFWGRQAAVWNNTGDTATISDQTATVISTFYVLTAKVPSVVATRATAVANAMESTIASSAEPARPLSEGVYPQ